MARFNSFLCLALILALAWTASAGVFAPPTSTGPVYEGTVTRINVSTHWVDVRAYAISIQFGYAICTGNGSARTCGACPLVSEKATFIVTWMNGTTTTLDNITEGQTREVAGQYKIKVTKIEEAAYVYDTEGGQCAYREAKVTYEFSPFVECTADSQCGSGLGCSNYACVSAECASNYQCAWNEYCTNRQCYSVPTGACGKVENHTWIQYQCCFDDDCSAGWVCGDHDCRRYRLCVLMSDCQFDEICSNETRHCEYIQHNSTCGVFSNHAWIDYECCNNTDCLAGKVCSNHSCIGCITSANCANDEACQSSTCVRLTGCGLIANHTLTPYECCNNTDCFDEFACTDHHCRPIDCPCGTIRNHECNYCTPTPIPTIDSNSTPEATITPQATPVATRTPNKEIYPCVTGFVLFSALALLAVASKSCKD